MWLAFSCLSDKKFQFQSGGAWWHGQEDIVVTGVSCRLPESDSMAELEHNLMNKIDMITEDRRRWEPGEESFKSKWEFSFNLS